MVLYICVIFRSKRILLCRWVSYRVEDRKRLRIKIKGIFEGFSCIGMDFICVYACVYMRRLLLELYNIIPYMFGLWCICFCMVTAILFVGVVLSVKGCENEMVSVKKSFKIGWIVLNLC